MKSRCITFSIMLFVTIWILPGCNSSENSTSLVGVTTTPLLPTKEATQASITSFFTQTPPPTQIQSPIPTLSKQDALEHFASSIESDDTCNLPCWQTIRIGETPFVDVQNIFSQYSSIASPKFSSEIAFLRMFFPEFENATHDIAVEVNPSNNGQIARILIYASTYQDKNGPIDYKNPEFQKLMQRYFLPGVFARNGMPEKIFLDTTFISVDAATSYPFVLWIVYPQQGFLIRYEGHNFKNGGNLVICPMQGRIEIKIWDAKQSNYEEFVQDDMASGSSTSLGPQPIESVSEFSTYSFFEMFRSGDINSCFETPLVIWPH